MKGNTVAPALAQAGGSISTQSIMGFEHLSYQGIIYTADLHWAFKSELEMIFTKKKSVFFFSVRKGASSYASSEGKNT